MTLSLDSLVDIIYTHIYIFIFKNVLFILHSDTVLSITNNNRLV